MQHFIDRRLNPKDKSLANRQRFLRRTRAQIKEAVNKSLQDRKIVDIGNGETVSIPSKGVREPTFRHSGHSGSRKRNQHESGLCDRGVGQQSNDVGLPQG